MYPIFCDYLAIDRRRWELAKAARLLNITREREIDKLFFFDERKGEETNNAEVISELF